MHNELALSSHSRSSSARRRNTFGAFAALIALALATIGGASSVSAASGTRSQDRASVTFAGGATVGKLTRLSGADRLDTAIAASKSAFATAGSATGVVLARSDVAADALAGTPLTKVIGGPLLLTPSGVLDGRTQTEIVRVLGPSSGRTVHLLGGSAALSDTIKTQIEGLGYVTVRYGGADRYETATRVATAIGAPSTVFLADGAEFADALIAGATAAKVGAAVLLTNGATMPAITNAYLTGHPGTRYTLGASATALPSGTVVAGVDPYERSVSLATLFWPTPSTAVGIASGEAFPDGLSGGAHIAHSGAPLLLVTSTTVPPSVSAYLTSIHANVIWVYGGTSRISDAVVLALEKTML
jgi:hypothetical protein